METSVFPQDLRMVHSALTIMGPVEKWVVPLWSLQAGVLGRSRFHDSLLAVPTQLQKSDPLVLFPFWFYLSGVCFQRCDL